VLAIEELKTNACAQVDRIADELIAVSDHLFHHPELGHEEFKSVALLRETLEKHGVASEAGVAELPTAFRADLAGKAPRPRIAILGEYDALPEIGHGCGHNIIGTSAVGVAIALSKVMADLPGSAVLFGTPCEESTAEGAGGKVPMVQQGLFDDVDASIMMHPSTQNIMSIRSSLAARGFDMEFLGKPAHAAAAPHKGINALDAVIQTFNSVNALRQHLKPDVRIHAIITHGGGAVNVVPAYAACRFRIRSVSASYRDEVVEKVLRAAGAAAQATGATFKYKEYAYAYDNFVPNRRLNDVFKANLEALGVPMDVKPREEGMGSTDYGTVSQRMPASCAALAIAGPEVHGHSREFAEATITETGHQALLNAAKAMAMTAIDLIADPALLDAAKAEWSAAL
jgi:amidohydrolase